MKLLTLIYPGLLLTSFCLMPRAIAQVTSDNISTTVDSPDGVNFTIENGDRAGSNLFHSFQDFSIPNNGSATFNNAPEIENIFSRVTGGNISNIEGAINANGSTNLLLINPAGIVFGENANLNIGGSFFATTADSLLFPEGEFSAVNPQGAPLLTVNRPIGLNFGDNPSSIVNRSGILVDSVNFPPGLEVNPGKELTFVGGEIRFDNGFATTAGGKIELGSVAEAGRVNLEPTATGFSLDYSEINNFGDIVLSDAGRIDASGLGGGEIRMQGRNVIFSGGSKIISNTLGSRSGQDINIIASDSVQILGTTDRPDLTDPSGPSNVVYPLRSSIRAETLDKGDAGDIRFETTRLILEEGGIISASSVSFLDSLSAPGKGGNIEIYASEAVEVTEVTEADTSEVNEEFNLLGSNAEVAGASTIATVTANSATAGNLIINTRRLTVSNGGLVTTTSFGAGKGGDLMIDATQTVDVFGESPKNGVTSRIVASSITTGTSGNIRINSEQIQVKDAAEIGARAFTIGIAGNINLDTSNLLLDNSIVTAATQAGDRGNINVNNAETILLRNNAQITTNATELATGGDINLDAEAIAIFNNSNITAIAEAGQGGNIQITTQGLLIEPDSEITAASELGIDGTITFNTPDVDPTSGIIELPVVPIDTESILAQDLCRVDNADIAGGSSSFIVTGRGGLTPTSAESLDNRDRVVNWADETANVSGGIVSLPQPKQAKRQTVVQSQGLAIAPDGSIWLTANAVNSTPQDSNSHPDCRS